MRIRFQRRNKFPILKSEYSIRGSEKDPAFDIFYFHGTVIRQARNCLVAGHSRRTCSQCFAWSSVLVLIAYFYGSRCMAEPEVPAFIFGNGVNAFFQKRNGSFFLP